LIATSSLQSLAYTFLTIAFFLSFYFSTCASHPHHLRANTGTDEGVRRLGKESSKREFVVGGAASVAGGLGLVLAFCAVGVNV
jgi:hypothetical protein